MELSVRELGILGGSVIATILLFIPAFKWFGNRITKQVKESIETDNADKEKTIAKAIDTHKISCRAEIEKRISEMDTSLKLSNLQQSNFQESMRQTVEDIHEKLNTLFVKNDAIYNILIDKSKGK